MIKINYDHLTPAQVSAYIKAEMERLDITVKALSKESKRSYNTCLNYLNAKSKNSHVRTAALRLIKAGNDSLLLKVNDQQAIATESNKNILILTSK